MKRPSEDDPYVLLVCEVGPTRATLLELLVGLGMRAVSAGGVDGAVQAISDEGRPPVMMVTELAVSGASGWEVLRVAREAAGRRVRVLVVTDTDDVQAPANLDGVFLMKTPVNAGHFTALALSARERLPTLTDAESPSEDGAELMRNVVVINEDRQAGAPVLAALKEVKVPMVVASSVQDAVRLCFAQRGRVTWLEGAANDAPTLLGLITQIDIAAPPTIVVLLKGGASAPLQHCVVIRAPLDGMSVARQLRELLS